MSGQLELDVMACRVIDGNRYMTLGTLDRAGRPRLSPVYYAPARSSEFYWVSAPQATHSRNVTERPEIERRHTPTRRPDADRRAVATVAMTAARSRTG